ncbi:MAG: T9SS type A sorting domain-containing protein [Crocinitomicaceae bacterium]|nr:T9SS type A sorting domain-containing protein [Crocinitomicaceae bacterium]MCF8434062.1 T9SS type A sorting domain-containing protein [Crocinitomicaceae bacterium]
MKSKNSLSSVRTQNSIVKTSTINHLNRLTHIFACAAFLFCFVQNGWGQTSIFSNAITGTNPNSTNPYTINQIVSSGITVSGIGRGSGITGSDANNRYNASGWNSSNLNSSDYFEWTITPSSCKEIDFVSFVYTSQRSNNSIANFAFRSSRDNFTTNIGTPDDDGTTISLSANTFQNITTPITFRLYAWGANQDSRTFSINDFTFNGTVSNTTPIQFPVLANGDYVWTGATNENWSTASNWSVYNSSANNFSTATANPNSSTLNVVIPPINSCNSAGIPTIRNVLLNGDRDVNNITIMQNGVLSIEDTDDLGVYGNWINNGTFNHDNKDAKVDFKHATSLQTIGGTSVTEFYRLEISENNSNNVVLNQNISVVNDFDFDGNRKLEIGNNSIVFISGASISGANSSRYIVTNGVGVVKRNVSIGNVTFPVGISLYNPCRLSNSGTSDVFSVRVIDNVTQDGTGIGTTKPSKCVKRTWMISEDIIGGSIVTMRLQWNGNNTEHINGFNYNPGFMYIAHHNGTIWENIGSNGESNAQNAHFLTQSNITSFSPFAIADASTPLPIELVSFQANCTDDNTVSVTWSTASEHNTSHFVIEKSLDAQNWSVLGVTGAAVNSSELLNYEMIDFDKSDGVVYYRLTQYDNDGQFEVFNVVALNCEINSSNALTTYPNPSENSFYVNLSTDEMKGNGQIIVTDGNGRVVYTKWVLLQNGNNVFIIEDIKAEPGIYYIKVSNETTTTYIVKHSLR